MGLLGKEIQKKASPRPSPEKERVPMPNTH